MGLKFRKSKKIAPGIRLNVGKKGASVTFGGKGARYTVSTSGRRTKSVSIPGTGISYSSTTKRSRSQEQPHRQSSTPNDQVNNAYQSPNRPKKKIPKGYKIAGCVLLIFLVIGIIGNSISDPAKTKESESETTSIITSSTDVTTERITEKIIHETQPQTEPLTQPEITAAVTKYVNVDSLNIRDTPDGNVIGTLSLGDKITIQKIEGDWAYGTVGSLTGYVASTYLSETEPVVANENAPQAQNDAEVETIVYISGSGKRYHRNASCSNMSNPQAVTISEAENMGLTPCKKCY